MASRLRTVFLQANAVLYQAFIRRLLFLFSAQKTHEKTMQLLALGDRYRFLQLALQMLHRAAFSEAPTLAGGVRLSYPLILAAGFVKGEGFDSEAEALAAVAQNKNILPGWRSVPLLVGLVEFGSFTRWPRLGNSGTVMWRDPPSRSTQNRVGLRNPGAKAAAAFLKKNRQQLPQQFGINIAVSPGVNSTKQEMREAVEAVEAFLECDITPLWFTLNLSCPNTDDDPTGNQTEDKAHQLCSALASTLNRAKPGGIPLWVKIGPNLSNEQYAALMRAFAETGVQAVIATNTLPAPSPDNPQEIAGMGGGALHSRAIEVAGLLMMEKIRHNYPVDIIGCGGVFSGETYQDYKSWGVEVMQYWSALVYRGPLAAALIMDEA